MGPTLAPPGLLAVGPRAHLQFPSHRALNLSGVVEIVVHNVQTSFLLLFYLAHPPATFACRIDYGQFSLLLQRPLSSTTKKKHK